MTSWSGCGRDSRRTAWRLPQLSSLSGSIGHNAGALERRRSARTDPLAHVYGTEDAEDLGILLSEAHPDLDPLTVRFTDLHRYVTELEGFADDPDKSNEGRLEAIQMAWHEEYEDAKG